MGNEGRLGEVGKAALDRGAETEQVLKKKRRAGGRRGGL